MNVSTCNRPFYRFCQDNVILDIVYNKVFKAIDQQAHPKRWKKSFQRHSPRLKLLALRTSPTVCKSCYGVVKGRIAINVRNAFRKDWCHVCARRRLISKTEALVSLKYQGFATKDCKRLLGRLSCATISLHGTIGTFYIASQVYSSRKTRINKSVAA